jgi:hypothetical protein
MSLCFFVKVTENKNIRLQQRFINLEKVFNQPEHFVTKKEFNEMEGTGPD